MRYAAPLLLLLLLAGCDAVDPDAFYPRPGNYPTITLAEALSAEAGRYNVEAYVGTISECPPDTECIVPDNFTAVDRPPSSPPESSLIVYAETPSQLDIGPLYLFSIHLEGGPSVNRTATLLGYVELQP